MLMRGLLGQFAKAEMLVGGSLLLLVPPTDSFEGSERRARVA